MPGQHLEPFHADLGWIGASLGCPGVTLGYPGGHQGAAWLGNWLGEWSGGFMGVAEVNCVLQTQRFLTDLELILLFPTSRGSGGFGRRSRTKGQDGVSSKQTPPNDVI